MVHKNYDDSSTERISANGETLRVLGGITTTLSSNDLTIALDTSSVVTALVQLHYKQNNCFGSNTVSGTAQFNTALTDGSFATCWFRSINKQNN